VEPSIPEEIVDNVVGHSEGKQGRNYGDVPMKTLYRAISKINLGAVPKPYA
jgi:hypothetical protein